MSRRNDLKKELWTIFRQVYQPSSFIQITEKQNEMLNKMVEHIYSTYSLRYRDEKTFVETADSGPLDRPIAAERVPFDYGRYKKLRRGESDDSDGVTISSRAAVAETKKIEVKQKVKASIDIDALPPHLRKYML
jgi:hypothetical protein